MWRKITRSKKRLQIQQPYYEQPGWRAKLNRTDRLKKPIFFVGVGRSGTTVIFEAFARHPQLAWPSNYSQKFPRLPVFNLLRRLLDNRLIRLTGRKKQYGHVHILNKYPPKPAEAYAFWEGYSTVPFARHYLLSTTADDKCRRQLLNAAGKIAAWQNKPRFTAKLTGPGRITFLRSIFPDARFVHVIRDGRAVVHSLLHVDFWEQGGGLTSPWWKGGLSQEAIDTWIASDRDPGVLAAIQWKTIIEHTRHEAGELGPGEYHEVRFENFISDTHGVISGLFEALDLPDSQPAHKYIDNIPRLRNMDQKYLTEWPPDYVGKLNRIMDPLLSDLGYEY